MNFFLPTSCTAFALGLVWEVLGAAWVVYLKAKTMNEPDCAQRPESKFLSVNRHPAFQFNLPRPFGCRNCPA